MKELLIVEHLKKTFKLSKKQQKLEQNKIKVKTAVDDLSFKAYQGEIYGLLGPNGAGKTTTLRILSTLIKPDSGDAFIDGISVVDNPTEIRKNIGFLTSELKLEDFFTPNYLFDYFASLHNVEPEVILERKNKLFQKFGIEEFKEVKVSDLSTGMKQKVSLVISIAHDPKIVIFDEPTNGLDIITAKTVTDFLVELRDLGKTIILSTHIFSLVEKLCDRVGIIINGKMILDDTLSNITKNDSIENVFFKLYEEQGGVLI
ncbi:MAG: ATP-binding cassette domain-containing protein [Acholeplasma sp.]|nr:ATP-binding cassette domain-containing protein [Acholeplasma sp.]